MLQIKINNKQVRSDCEPRTHLADFLREKNHLTGTHLGCEHGVCGACTVLVDGVPTRSCITFAHACDGASVTTIEGLDEDEIAAELRAAFSREHGLQCGYCTPGMVVTARDIVLRMEDPSEHDIRVALSGNLCRCTGYVGIVRAVQSVIEARRGRGLAAIPGGGRDRLGPAGSGYAGAVEEMRREPATSAVQAAPRAASVNLDDNWQPQNTLEDSFTVSHSPDVVWAFFGEVDEVVSCLPGASLNNSTQEGHVEGQIKVKVGPISAEFLGVAQITRDEAARTGTIDGSGKDKRSNSATRGRIRYIVREGETADRTRVDLSIGYTLSGMLAQFSRSGLVQDVANRLIRVFVQNLEARLNHEASGGSKDTAPQAAALDAGSLMSSVVLGQIKKVFAGLFKRN